MYVDAQVDDFFGRLISIIDAIERDRDRDSTCSTEAEALRR
jgi:hypothetical protein